MTRYYSQHTKRCSRVSSIPPSYTGRPGFKFGPEIEYTDTIFVVWFSSSKEIPG
jgi:hypothetical protein